MNLSTKNTNFFFFGALVLTLLAPALYPWMRIAYFIPFVILLFYKKSFISCLWGSIGCGIILDFLSPHSRLGLNAVAFALTTTLLYRQRRNFFADSITTLPLMTFFYSITSTLIHVILIHIFDKSIPLSNGWLIKDLILMPSVDAAFAFCVYILPFLLFGKPARAGKDYFQEE